MLTKVQNVHIVVVVQDLLPGPLALHLDGTGATADDQLSANKSTTNPPSRTGAISKWTNLGDLP